MNTTTNEKTEGNLDNPWAARLASLTLAPAIGHRGLQMYPLVGPDDAAVTYLTLDQALIAGTVIIGESGAGSVPELNVINAGGARVLIVDGEELIGAKQNRIVNTTVLIEANTTALLPVSCVEQGRWNQESAAFRSEATHYNSRGRQAKADEVSLSLLVGGRPAADQGRVWGDVAAKLSRMAVSSDTHALRDLSRERAEQIHTFQEALAVRLPGQVGAAFAIGREIVGLDLFNLSSTLQMLLPKLIGSYALDVLDERPTSTMPSAATVEEWLETVRTAPHRTHPAVALGHDARLVGNGLSGGALLMNSTVVHLSAFRHTRAHSEPGPATSGMARASTRLGMF